MKKSRLIALLCILSILSCKENNTEAQSALTKKVINEKVGSSDFNDKIENKDVQLIDVRTPNEYNEGHIKNAKNIDFYAADFYDEMNKLDKNAALYIYCRSGNRSGKAAAKLKEHGFKEVYDLQGGILDWLDKGLSVQR